MNRTISAYYIVKDETDFLYFSIESIFKYVDELVFIWTVTDDDLDATGKIIEHFSERVLDKVAVTSDPHPSVKIIPVQSREKFRDGYAGLRNRAHKECSGTHLLKLDGDEVPYDNFGPKLRQLLQTDTMAYICMMNEFVFDKAHILNRHDPYGNYVVNTRMFFYKNKFGMVWVPTTAHGYHEVLRGSISLEKLWCPGYWGDNHVVLLHDLYICHFGSTKWARTNPKKLQDKRDRIIKGKAKPGKILQFGEMPFTGKLPEVFDRTPGWLQKILDERRKREREELEI